MNATPDTLPSDSEIVHAPARELVRRLASRELSAEELMTRFLARIDEVNPKVNAIVTLLPDAAVEGARAADAALARGEPPGPLHGLPIAIKDLTVTRGIRTTFGSPIYREFVPDEDALYVERLRRAGAIIIGKTNTPEFGAGSQTFNPVFGATRNPFAPERTCGGSSGGAAVAVACAMLPLADGTDMGGSLRNPAAWSNVVGFRTSPGRVPVWPRNMLYNPLGVAGPIARHVSDAALLLSAMAGPDPRVPLSIETPGARFREPLERDFAGARIAWSATLGGYPVDGALRETCAAAAARFEDLGCAVEEADPDLRDADASFALRELSLADTAGEGWSGNAREVRLGGIERWFGGNRVAGSDLSANAVAWEEDAASARDIGIVSVTLDLMGRFRWQASGGRLNGVDVGVSGRARADAVAMESLTMSVAEESMIGISGFESGGLTFDGENLLQASSATAGRARFRVRGDVSVDATGLRADALEWNGESLAAERGEAPLMSVRAAPVRASLDSVKFGSARLGARGLLHLDALSAASFRGDVASESHLQWTAGNSRLAGYRARGSGEATLDFVETREVEVVVVGDDARLRADRFAVRDTRLDSSGDLRLANVHVDGVTSGRANDNRFSADAVRGGHVVLRDAGLEMGSLDLSGLETTIGMNEKGEWDLPLPPLGTGSAGAPYSVRIDEAGIVDHRAVVHVVDRTTDPEFAARVDVARATLRGYRSSAPGSPARFSIESAADAFSSARVEGALIPTLTGTDLDLNADLRGLTLPAFSPYARLHLGHDLAAGQADATLALAVRSADLDGVVDFRPSGVRFRDTESRTNRSVLGSALALIEERNGAIELKATLRGGVDDPDFNLDRLLVHALADSALDAAEVLEKAE